MNSNNPASRLLDILLLAKKEQPHTLGRTAWRNILNVKNDINDTILISRIGKVMELPSLILNEINNNFPTQKESSVHWNKQVTLAFSRYDLNTEWSKFTVHIDEHTISYLNMTVVILDSKSSIKIISSEELKKIRVKIDKLLKEIIELELDSHFKQYITRYLRKILLAIDEYNITGVIPIIESIESTVGHTFFDKTYREELQNTDHGKNILKVLSSVAGVVTVSLGLPQIASNITQHLLSE